MIAYPNTPQAWERTQGVARSVGVDLPRAVLDGWFSRRELDGLVLACHACGDKACPTAQPAPGTLTTCRNQSNIAALRL